jgi:hypothetical protein
VFAQLMFAASFARKDFSVGASPLSGMVFLDRMGRLGPPHM